VHLDVSIGRPIFRGDLTIFPVFNHQEPAPRYLTGPRAEASGALTISERAGAAAVRELVVHNLSRFPVLLVEGETLLGNKQNRTLNVSVLCPPGAVAVPVSCVEQGRWDAARPSRRSGSHAPLGLRDRKTASVVEAVMRGDGKASDQIGVWREVAQRAARWQVDSATGALEDVYGAANRETRDLVGDLRPVAGQAGVVVAVGRRIRVLELFDRVETLGDYWDALMAGYALDAAADKVRTHRPGADDVLAFLDRVREATVIEAEPAGMGRELHLRSPNVHGSALTWEGGLVHLCAFADTRTRGPARGSS
jgi:hypothetical protein